jgi:hypothetical protein
MSTENETDKYLIKSHIAMLTDTKYFIPVSIENKNLLEFFKDYPYIMYNEEKDRIMIQPIPILNFEVNYNNYKCFFSILYVSDETTIAYIHGNDLNFLKEFSIMLNEDNDGIEYSEDSEDYDEYID